MTTMTVADAVNEVLAKHPARHNQTEALLRERVGDEGKRWQFLGDVPRGSMSVRQDGNELRVLEHINDEKVQRIANKVADGAVMPAVIVTRKGRRLVEGHHRWHAYDRAGVPTIAAYEVDLDGDLLDQLIIEVTQMAGDRLAPAEVKLVAMRYIQKGFAEARVASMLGVPLSTLRQWAAISKLQQRLQATGNTYDLDGWSNRMCSALVQIRNLPSLVAAVELVRDARLKGNDVASLVQAVRAQQSQAEELHVVQEQREAMADRINADGHLPGGPAYMRPYWMQSLPALGLLSKYTAEQFVDAAPQDQVARLLAGWAAVVKVGEEAVARLGARGGHK